MPDRIASDAGELARARRAGELAIAAVLPGRRGETGQQPACTGNPSAGAVHPLPEPL